jgi:hypothetical protein
LLGFLGDFGLGGLLLEHGFGDFECHGGCL